MVSQVTFRKFLCNKRPRRWPFPSAEQWLKMFFDAFSCRLVLSDASEIGIILTTFLWCVKWWQRNLSSANSSCAM